MEPAGKPVKALPEIRENDVPELVLRKSPPPPAFPRVQTESAAANRTLPRAATLVMSWPASVALPRTVHVFPPSVEINTPILFPPSPAKLLRRALPALSV